MHLLTITCVMNNSLDHFIHQYEWTGSQTAEKIICFQKYPFYVLVDKASNAIKPEMSPMDMIIIQLFGSVCCYSVADFFFLLEGKKISYRKTYLLRFGLHISCITKLNTQTHPDTICVWIEGTSELFSVHIAVRNKLILNTCY